MEEYDWFGHWMWITAILSLVLWMLLLWGATATGSALLSLLSTIVLIICFWSWGYSMLTGFFLFFIENRRVKNLVGSVLITILLIYFAVGMGY
ncbi:hypothetical protein EI28_13660 [Methanoculleus sp. MH98A]|nr:hypothetical protein EI28_13660 [Methanoculleus sp. MH98A]